MPSGGEMQMIHVLIVENDPMARCLLEMFVSQNETYGVVASITCADLTPDLIREKAVHLALVNMEGLASASWLKEQFPYVKLIAMTGKPEHTYIERAKACGADSFWYQQSEAEALIEFMNRTMAGENLFPKPMTVYLGQALSSDLTERELQVLRQVVAGATDAEIAARLGISLRTVKGHIQNLREKTGYRNRTELAVHARSSGLIIQ